MSMKNHVDIHIKSSLFAIVTQTKLNFIFRSLVAARKQTEKNVWFLRFNSKFILIFQTQQRWAESVAQIVNLIKRDRELTKKCCVCFTQIS